MPETEPLQLRFECTQCGKCCTNRGEFAHVYLNPEELRALAAFKDMKAGAFRRRYTFRDEDGWTQLRFVDENCMFLDTETMRCTVYEARPTQCRTFPFWRDNVEKGAWTEEVAKHCEGIGRGPLHPPDEIEANMVAMEESDED